MIWRGEAWKAAFLESQQQVSELQQQQRTSISPKTVHPSQRREFSFQDQPFRSDGGLPDAPIVSPQSPDSACQASNRRQPSHARAEESLSELRTLANDSVLAAPGSDGAVCSVAARQLFQSVLPALASSPQGAITADLVQ